MTAPLVDIENCIHERAAGADRFRLAVDRFALFPGDQIALVGPSGCGKSTMLDLLSLILAPTAAARFALSMPGRAAVDVMALWRGGGRDRLTALRAAHMGYVLQTGGLVPFLSVRENILLTRRALGLPCPGPAETLMEWLGVAELGRRLPRQISIGQRQRVAIARALAHRPALILADEPTASLDPSLAEGTMALLSAVARHQGAALVVVTHDHALAERTGLTVVECRAGTGASTIRHEAASVEAAA
ncbi:ABC transporter ATP-binding protein [Azospirillum sp. B506]|uniref:ABC transporter ATP-binding protein n=1 Tax=Azospirillum sp. B506 TaxID=137721 RepID=UPI000348AFF7|nr:ATP-binding cassette domain-containing protein [Azospirillum sp. B506]